MLDFLNITNAEGEVVTLFGGKVTLQQFVAILLTIVVVGIIISVVKKAIKLVLVAVVICVGLVHYNIASPDQIKDVASKIADKGVESYQLFADTSKNIKIDGTTVQVCIDDKWYDIADVTSIIGDDKGNATVTVDGETHAVNDSVVIELIQSFI